MAYGTLNAGAITPGSGNTLTVSETVSFTGAVTGTTIDATTDFTVGGTVLTDGNIADTGTLSIVPVDGCTIALGTDAGDDFNVGSGKLVVEGDTGYVGIAGKVLIGTTSAFSLANLSIAPNLSSYPAIALRPGTNFYTSAIMLFQNYSGSNVGWISITASATSYNTASDYRLKENVVSMSGSIDRLKLLKPSRFNFIADADTTVDGFLAHEAQAVVPEAITGEKDAMTEAILYVEGDELPEGKIIGDVKTASVPDMQGIDQSKLVPLLVSALQEAITRIETLESA